MQGICIFEIGEDECDAYVIDVTMVICSTKDYGYIMF